MQLEVTTTPEPRRVLIDALNLAYWCGAPPSLRIPLSLASALQTAGHQACLYFDASAPRQLGHEAEIYQRLLRFDLHCIEVPSGRSADELLLKHARSSDACIVSRDRYRDYRRRYRKLIDDPGRLMAGSVENDVIVVAGLGIAAPLAAAVESAWEQLSDFLNARKTESESAHVAEPSELSAES